MALASNHPDLGYYQTQEPFGAEGDFITAPEISQVFGELLGLWLATAWHEAGQPKPFRLVELGPGRGQLMADLVRATAKVPAFLDAADIHLVESSEKLRAVQRKALPHLDLHWHDRLDNVLEGPLFLIGNEFLDALPVHQLIKTETGWAERLVSINDNGELIYLSDSASPATSALVNLVAGSDDAKTGDVAEVSPARNTLAGKLGERLAKDGGVALLIDYGALAERPTGDTLQAVFKHQPVDPLSMPGIADITTQVDFRSIAMAARAGGASIYGPVPQGTFLRTLGIEPRTAALLKNADDQQRHHLRSALFRLTDASAMGEVFKVLVLASSDDPPPPGFAPPDATSNR
jgi:NADH dehydrogenase [ubiquinone] 1 alpha subcomplex assembly factor 7